jgi:hypothetical protein
MEALKRCGVPRSPRPYSSRFSLLHPYTAGVPHAVDLPADGSGRMLIICQPAGFDQFLAELITPSPAQLGDDSLLNELNLKYDIINLGGVPTRP